jgi:hypothetical protein
MNDTLVAYNSADIGGGLDIFGVLNIHAYVFQRNVIRNNQAVSKGGGIYVGQSNSNLGTSFTRNLVASNNAGVNGAGGGVYLESNSGKFEGLWVAGNQAKLGGGMVVSGGSPIFSNLLVVDNTVSSSGPGISAWSATLAIKHATLAHNTGGEGSALLLNASPQTLTLTNAIISNQAIGVSAGASASAGLEGMLWYQTSTHFSGSVTIGTVDLVNNPAFQDAALGNYHITYASPARKNGVIVGVGVDFEGDARPNGAKPDIGADQYYAKAFMPAIMK